MEGDQSNFSSIADLLQNDQVLSGRILHYANSAFVGSRTEIATISRAISLLGFTTVRSSDLGFDTKLSIFGDTLMLQVGCDTSNTYNSIPLQLRNFLDDRTVLVDWNAS